AGLSFRAGMEAGTAGRAARSPPSYVRGSRTSPPIWRSATPGSVDGTMWGHAVPPKAAGPGRGGRPRLPSALDLPGPPVRMDGAVAGGLRRLALAAAPHRRLDAEGHRAPRRRHRLGLHGRRRIPQV